MLKLALAVPKISAVMLILGANILTLALLITSYYGPDHVQMKSMEKFSTFDTEKLGG